MSEGRITRTYSYPSVVVVFILILAAAAVAVATRYEYIPAGKDMTYRVNRWTGLTMLCAADSCTPVTIKGPISTSPVSAMLKSTTWDLKLEDKSNHVFLAGSFDSRGICETALQAVRLQRKESALSCEARVVVSTDPNGTWWVVLTKDLDTPKEILARLPPSIHRYFLPSSSMKTGEALDGPYASEAICEVARIDRSDFSNLDCSQLKVWKPITMAQHGNVVLALSTKWEDGEMRYRFSISPLSPQIKDAKGKPFSAYTVIIQYSDNFPIAKLSVSLSGMTQIVDKSDRPASLEYYGTQAMSAKAYNNIGGWTVEWNF